MSFVEHLSELRLRLRNAGHRLSGRGHRVVLLREELLRFLTRPARPAWTVALQGQEPVFRFASPTEPFWVYTKLAMYGALLVASPFVFWELWKFIAPGPLQEGKAHGAGRDHGHRAAASWAARSSATSSSARRR